MNERANQSGRDWHLVNVCIQMDFDIRHEPPMVAAAVFRLTFLCAHNYVNVYSNVKDGSIYLGGDKEMGRVLGITAGQWRKIKGAVLRYFDVGNDRRVRAPENWINAPTTRIPKVRPSLSPALRVKVGERDQWTCGYCGAKDGPFDVDHVVPIALSGAENDMENLLLACARCNRSKGSKMVSEWIS